MQQDGHEPLGPEVAALDLLLQVSGDVMERILRQDFVGSVSLLTGKSEDRGLIWSCSTQALIREETGASRFDCGGRGLPAFGCCCTEFGLFPELLDLWHSLLFPAMRDDHARRVKSFSERV
jgi:hypothetical protein